MIKGTTFGEIIKYINNAKNPNLAAMEYVISVVNDNGEELIYDNIFSHIDFIHGLGAKFNIDMTKKYILDCEPEHIINLKNKK